MTEVLYQKLEAAATKAWKKKMPGYTVRQILQSSKHPKALAYIEGKTRITNLEKLALEMEKAEVYKPIGNVIHICAV